MSVALDGERVQNSQDTLGSVLDGLVEVGIVKDDVGTLSSELEGDLLEVGLGRLLHDLSTNGGGSGESDLVNVGVGGQGVSDSGSVTAVRWCSGPEGVRGLTQ